MPNFSSIFSGKDIGSLLLLLLCIVNFILFWIAFGSTLNIPDRYTEDEHIKNAKNAAKVFGVLFLIPLAFVLLYLLAKKIK